jgi:putative sigma-54 modulation protein
METRVTARHFELSDPLRRLAEEHSTRLRRFFDRIIENHWTLTREKSRQTAELTVKVYGTVLTSKVVSHDIVLAVEGAADKMERQLKKYKERLKEKNVKKISTLKTGGEMHPPAAEY